MAGNSGTPGSRMAMTGVPYRRRTTVPLLVLIVVALVIAAILAAHQLTAPVAAPPDPTVIVQKAAGLLQTTAFHFLYTVNGQNSGSSGLNIDRAEGDFVAPDKLQASIGASTSGGAVTSEVIILGQKSYLLNPLSNQWGSTANSGFDPASLFDPSKGIASILNQVKSLTYVDSPSLNIAGTNTLTDHVKATVPSSALSVLLGQTTTAATAQAELWIARSDGMVRRVLISGPLSDTESADTSRTLDLSNFNHPISIKAPI